MRLSDHYELQSMTDIGRAQAIAKVDQSGHALGTAMYLAQQSVEKQLKSIVLRMDEALGMGNVDRILRGHSHEFYPSLYESYRLYIECPGRALRRRWSVRPDPEAFAYTESVAKDFRDASSYWANYRNNRGILRLTWLRSLGASLPKEDLHKLNRWHEPQLAFVLDDAPASGGDDPKLADVFPATGRIRTEILDDYAIAWHRVEHARAPANVQSRMALEGTLENTRLNLLQTLGNKHADIQAELARMGLFEFGLHVMATLTQRYVLLYPHNSFGRYPEPVGNGLFTTDIYERQANDVLAYLFVIVPYHLRELCASSGIIGRRAEEGRRLGYWGTRPARPPGGNRRAGRPRKRRKGAPNGQHRGQAANMAELAARYARQADSDMKHAHAAARADFSGYALADAMLLGQQSLETHLKAATLVAAEMLGADGALDLPGARGHDAYRWILGLYARHAGSARASGPGAAPDPGVSLAIRRSAGFWEGYSGGRELQELAWRHSIGAPLGKGGQKRLDEGLLPCARDAGILAGDPGAGMPRLAREDAAGGTMRDEVLCPNALRARRRAHMRSRWNHGMRVAVRRRFDACRAMPPRDAAGGGEPSAGPRGAPPGRLAAWFCLTSLAMLGPGYLHAYPHYSLGRYPGVVGGRVATDTYRDHADGVRHLLFVDIPCQAWQVSRVVAFSRMLRRARGGARGKPAP